jgi:hypothetical protein
MPINANPSDLNASMHTLVTSLDQKKNLDQALQDANITGGVKGLEEFLDDFVTYAKGNAEAMQDLNKLKSYMGKVKQLKGENPELSHLRRAVEHSAQLFEGIHGKKSDKISSQEFKRLQEQATRGRENANKTFKDEQAQRQNDAALENFRSPTLKPHQVFDAKYESIQSEFGDKLSKADTPQDVLNVFQPLVERQSIDEKTLEKTLKEPLELHKKAKANLENKLDVIRQQSMALNFLEDNLGEEADKMGLDKWLAQIFPNKRPSEITQEDIDEAHKQLQQKAIDANSSYQNEMKAVRLDVTAKLANAL